MTGKHGRMEIEPADEADLPALWELFRSYHEEVASFSGERPLPTEERFTEYWRPSEDRFPLLARTDGEAVGFCLLHELEDGPHETGRCLELGAIFLRPDHRRGGNAALLWDAALRRAARLRIPLVSEFAHDNQQSLALVLAFRDRRSEGAGACHVAIHGDGAPRTTVIVTPRG